jgi:hypothetical protein
VIPSLLHANRAGARDHDASSTRTGGDINAYLCHPHGNFSILWSCQKDGVEDGMVSRRDLGLGLDLKVGG